MASDYIELGPVPCDEECQQVGTESYSHSLARFESGVYRRQLQRMFPKARFGVKSFPHDFGNYLEVVVYFDDSNPEEIELAFSVENALPAKWDEEALVELATVNQ